MTTSSQIFSRALPALAPSTAPSRPGMLVRISAALATVKCRLQGHSASLCIDEHRLYLLCTECQVESPGWDLDLRAPRKRFDGAADRFNRYAWIVGKGRA